MSEMRLSPRARCELGDSLHKPRSRGKTGSGRSNVELEDNEVGETGVLVLVCRLGADVSYALPTADSLCMPGPRDSLDQEENEAGEM